MVVVPVSEIIVGLYLGLLTGIFPALIAFAIGFGFKYFTDVTVPAVGVVVLGAALAGISGGLMGLLDPELAGSWTGITAVLVILMAALWAHSQGDKLAAATPRKLGLKTIRENKLSTEILERVDSFGQIRIRSGGDVGDVEGYPPLPDAVREDITNRSWKFPADLPLDELEDRLEERLLADYELAEVVVSIDRDGRASIDAAPGVAGLSRRVPPGQRAVSVKGLLPTGLARGDVVSVQLEAGAVTGPVVSAWTDGGDGGKAVSKPADQKPAADGEDEGESTPRVPKAPTTAGGEGRVTIAVQRADVPRLVAAQTAPVIVRSRGSQREYEAVGLLKRHGNRFRKVVIADDSPLVGRSIGGAQVRATYGVGILSVRRPKHRIVAPRGDVVLKPGDELIVVGSREGLNAFAEAAG